MMQSLRPGEVISSRFRLTVRLGAGGMGEVWSAWDNELQEQVAIKVISAELSARPEILELLRRECRNTRRLVHSNIVRVYDFHRAGERAFISMELIEGESVDRLRGAPPRDIVSMLIPVVEALGYAHTLGIVHRDVKASNVMVDRAGKPLLLDFGIAAVLHPGPGEAPLSGGGSPHSMSPQQRRGEPPQPSDDIYACGVLLFELLHGHPPAITEAPGAQDSRQGDGLHDAVLSMLAREPADRPSSMPVLAAELAPYAQTDPNLTQPPSARAPQETMVPSPLVPRTPSHEPEIAGPPQPRTAHLPARFIIPAFLVMVAVILGVFLVLPDFVGEKDTRVEAPEATDPAAGAPQQSSGRASEAPPLRDSGRSPSPPVPPPSAADKRAAEEALGEYLQVQARLEEQAAAVWAPDSYADAVARAEEGDAALRDSAFATAAEHYREAIDLLAAVSAGAGEALGDFLTRGDKALGLGDGTAATDAFEVALAIDPGNGRATEGMHRARTAKKVHDLIIAGEIHEADGRLAFAHADFAAAMEIDAAASRAREGLERVQQRIAQERFQGTMSEGLAALGRRDYQGALAVFREARSLRPNSPAVSDGIVRASEGIRLERLASLRHQAETLEALERWEDAAARYESALAIDRSLVFAQQGKQRALARAAVIAKLDYYLADPSLLRSPRVREKVLVFIGEAGAVEPKGPGLTQRVAALREQVLLATQPLEVNLRSDGATEVVVYRLGNLGRFTSRQLSLRPGTYTIVGSRPGYRDVRREITLAAGKKVPPIYVACEEPI